MPKKSDGSWGSWYRAGHLFLHPWPPAAHTWESTSIIQLDPFPKFLVQTKWMSSATDESAWRVVEVFMILYQQIHIMVRKWILLWAEILTYDNVSLLHKSINQMNQQTTQDTDFFYALQQNPVTLGIRESSIV